jgi:hypothetical protein
VRRRELLFLLGGAALLCSPIGRAQEPGRVYRLGIMAGLLREDSGYVALFDKLVGRGLSKAGTCRLSAASQCA